MRCNEKIKFAALLEKALELGFDAVCTGHYATILDGCRRQPRAAPRERWAKDQSYVLGVLTAEQLAHTLLPARRRRRPRRSCAPRRRRAG